MCVSDCSKKLMKLRLCYFFIKTLSGNPKFFHHRQSLSYLWKSTHNEKSIVNIFLLYFLCSRLGFTSQGYKLPLSKS